MDLTFTKCTLEHLDLLTQVSRQTFVDAYEKHNTPENFKIYLDTSFSKKQIALELKNLDTFFYFVYLDSIIIGYFKWNETQNEKLDVTSIALERIYVLQKFQNRQFGKCILDKIIAIAKSKNILSIWLGVWQKNVPAIRFYEKHGFIKTKTHDFMLGTDKHTDWVMSLKLD